MEEIFYILWHLTRLVCRGTKTLDVLDRVFGSADKVSSSETFNVLSIVCKKLHQASSHKEAEMVKSIEMLLGIWILL